MGKKRSRSRSRSRHKGTRYIIKSIKRKVKGIGPNQVPVQVLVQEAIAEIKRINIRKLHFQQRRKKQRSLLNKLKK